MFFSGPAFAACTDPDRPLATLIYNPDSDVFQGCTLRGWKAWHAPDSSGGGGSGPTGCDNIGEQCSDGSYYIGLSPEDGEKVYMTSAAHEGSLIRWDEDPPCYRCGLDDTGATSITDGRANVEALRAYAGDNATEGNLDGFGAAKYCDNLSAHTHDDWYLPAGGTGAGTEHNLFWTMVQSEGAVGFLNISGSWYWSSSELTSIYASIQRFSDGNQNFGTKSTSVVLVRCVRRGPPVHAGCTNPERPVGRHVFNEANGYFQGCTKRGWMAFHAPHSGGGPPADPCETGPIGTQCADGAVYAGETVGGARMYVADADQSGTHQWKTSQTATAGTGSTSDGLGNTNAMETAGLAAHPAGQSCRNRGADWYLPAIDELGMLYSNRAQLGAANLPTSGGFYWSSSENASDVARIQRFSDGVQAGGVKTINSFLVRCVRR